MSRGLNYATVDKLVAEAEFTAMVVDTKKR